MLGERGRRPHDEDAAALEPFTVLVQQVGDPVERHDGLAGPGPTGDDQRARRRRPDDPVLVGLDGGHDVTEVAGPDAGEGGEQRALPRDRRDPEGLRRVGVQHLVVEVVDPTSTGGQRPATGDPVGAGRRRPVEGPGGGRSPVDEEHVTGLVDDRHPSDVEVIAVGQVEPTEGERLDVAEGQAGRPHGVVVGGHVPLEHGLEGAAPRLAVGRDPSGLGACAQGLDPIVDEVEVRLFLGDRGPLGARCGFAAARACPDVRICRVHSAWSNRAVSTAARAESAPLFPSLPPARSTACSQVSVVRTPKATGMPCACDTLEAPEAHSPAT